LGRWFATDGVAAVGRNVQTLMRFQLQSACRLAGNGLNFHRLSASVDGFFPESEMR